MLSFGMWFPRGSEEAELAGQQDGGTWPARCHFSHKLLGVSGVMYMCQEEK